MRIHQIGAVANLGLAALSIWIPMNNDLSILFKGIYLILLFLSYFAMLRLFQRGTPPSAVIFSGIGYIFISCLLIFDLDKTRLSGSTPLLFNIAWLVLLFIFAFAISAFHSSAPQVGIANNQNIKEQLPMPGSWIAIMAVSGLFMILWIVLLVAVIMKKQTLVSRCLAAALALSSVEFLLVRDVMQKRLASAQNNLDTQQKAE